MTHDDDKHDHAHNEHGDSGKHANTCEMCGHAHDEKSGKCACGCG